MSTHFSADLCQKKPHFPGGGEWGNGFLWVFLWRKGVKKFALLVDILPIWSYMSRQKILPWKRKFMGTGFLSDCALIIYDDSAFFISVCRPDWRDIPARSEECQRMSCKTCPAFTDTLWLEVLQSGEVWSPCLWAGFLKICQTPCRSPECGYPTSYRPHLLTLNV